MIVKLSVHKNTLKQHRAKVLRNRMKANVKAIMTSDINGYALIAWYDDGSCNSCWSVGDTDPHAMPDKVRNVLIRKQITMDREDREKDC